MGKHSAADDATVHPLVADALARRSGVAGAAHDADAPERGGSTGWPEPPPGGGSPVGWPDDARPDRDGDGHPQERTGGGADRSAASVGTAPRRRGWRRLFGVPPAA
ncbi:hypothetical protein SAMN05660748_1900 [Blastococcus aggregatus]|uniref:Uncharacterized protein n=1 Tax=Blastococcus aggregatus TaxID=38502 RepID=A0A285V9J6_9ACTN|nr:hypothetical protein [Blastococcus aggregatus]SOC49181.1 hypothetical protein SAMN05660748_1900 [Blastococcus aggregatus]